MKLRELIGKKLNCVYCKHTVEQGWLDSVDCFLQLEDMVIGIPFSLSQDVWIREPEGDKVDYNPGGASVVDLLEYRSFKNITADTVFIELSNGNVITLFTMAPCGTGQAGLHVYPSVNDVEQIFGRDYLRISDEIFDISEKNKP